MKIESKTSGTTTGTRELTDGEIESVSGGSFRIALPGSPNANWTNRSTGPLLGGYVHA